MWSVTHWQILSQLTLWSEEENVALTTTTLITFQKSRECPTTATVRVQASPPPWTSTTPALWSRKSPTCTRRDWWVTSAWWLATSNTRLIVSFCAHPATSFKWCWWTRAGRKAKRNESFSERLRVSRISLISSWRHKEFILTKLLCGPLKCLKVSQNSNINPSKSQYKGFTVLRPSLISLTLSLYALYPSGINSLVCICRNYVIKTLVQSNLKRVCYIIYIFIIH